MKQFTMDQVDLHVENILKTAAVPSKAAPDLCKVFHTVEPILVFIAPLLRLLKPKWATVLDAAIAAIDQACPKTN